MTSRTESTPVAASCSSTTKCRMRRSCISAVATLTFPVRRGGYDWGGDVTGDPRLSDIAEPGGGVHHVAVGEYAGDVAALLHHYRADAMVLPDLGGVLQ